MDQVKIKGDLWVKAGEDTYINISASSPELLKKVEGFLAKEISRDPIIKMQTTVLRKVFVASLRYQ